MRDSFVFYESFREILELLENAEEWRDLMRAIFAYVFDGKDGFLSDPKLQIAFTHFKISIDGASARYEKAVEDGKKGGRPTKREFISPDVWINAIEEHGSIPKAAVALGLSKPTLYKWVNASDDPRLEKVKKLKNLSVSVSDSVSVSESDAVAYSDSDKRNINNKNKKGTNAAGGFNSPTAPAPRKNNNLVTDPFLEMMRREIGIDKYEFGTGRVKKKDGEDEAK